MIFITLGTQSCDFSRCMKMAEEWAIKYNIKEPIIAQTGYTSYKPAGFKCFDFVSENDYQQYIEEAGVVISHAGTGALFSSIKKGKKIIAVARLQKHGEMVDNHQTEIVRKLTEEGLILDGTNSIIEAWDKIEDFIPTSCAFENNITKEVEKSLKEWME